MLNDENMQEQLLALYRSKKLLANEEPVPVALHLHECCDMAAKCWQSYTLKRRPDTGSDNGKISLPWIGSAYKMFRILVLGENFYECGGLNAQSELVAEAMSQMRRNVKRVLGGTETTERKKYRGTFLYYKMACYSKALTFFLGQGTTDTNLLGLGDATQVVEFLDNIAHTNHVKCSPSGDLSRPETAMWEECGKHILVEEIRILDPEWIIVLGKGNNSYYLSRFVSPAEVQSIGTVSGFVGQIGGKSIRIVVVPHPSYYRAKVSDVVAGLSRLARSF